MFTIDRAWTNIMGAPRIRKVSNNKKLENIVGGYVTQGYKIDSRGEKTARVKRKDYGTARMHIIGCPHMGCWQCDLCAR